MDAETALAYDPVEEDDGLAYYEDGVKRTLTDEQIEVFRRSEIKQLVEQGRLPKEEWEKVRTDVEAQNAHGVGQEVSPASEESSIEDELMGAMGGRETLSTSKNDAEPARQNARSETPPSTSTPWRLRTEKIPYDQRHKRKWENYVDDNDPIHGSITHRRAARELDEQRDEKYEMDY